MTALEELGYYFDENEVLRTKEDNSTFQFTTQQDYEELGEAITEEIYRLLEDRCGLEKIYLKPAKSDIDNEDVGFVFGSPGFASKNTLLVLIHGSGVVRAGQWARRLIINNNLSQGTQFPYIERAIQKGWGVLVLNTNHNSTESEDLKFSETPVNHSLNAWKWLVEPSKAKEIFVVAHSRGGYDISRVLQKYGDDERLSIVCLTDSPCFQFSAKIDGRKKPLIVVNYLASGKFDSPQYRISNFKKDKVAELYAGTPTHECSSYKSMESIFFVFENHINEENFVEILTKAKPMVLEKTLENDDEDQPSSKKKRIV